MNISPAKSCMRGFILIMLFFGIAGCGTVPINLEYRPASAAQPLAPDIRSKLYIAPVIDKTGGLDSYGGDINQQLKLKGPLRATVVTPYIVSLTKGLTLELGRLGIPVVESREKADAIIEVTLTKTVAYVTETGTTNVPVYGAFEFTLSLKDLNRQVLWENEIRGRGQGLLSAPSYLRVGAGPNDAMNTALADAMEQIGPLFRSDNVVMILSRQGRKDP